MTNPVFLAEVLSPSTEALDRGAKASEYRRTDAIRQFALIAQDEPIVEIHTRDTAGFWRIDEVRGLDGVCNFTQIGCEVSMRSIYERVIQT